MEQRISKLSLDKGNKLKEGHGGLPRSRGYCVYVGRKGSVKENFFSSYVRRGVHGKGVCKNQIWKEVVCNKY